MLGEDAKSVSTVQGVPQVLVHRVVTTCPADQHGTALCIFSGGFARVAQQSPCLVLLLFIFLLLTFTLWSFFCFPGLGILVSAGL